MTKTFTQKFIERLQDNAPNIETIHKLISEHDTSKMLEGVRYYNKENDIFKRKQYKIENGFKVEDHEKPNNKIPSGWHKTLVDQKVAYLVGNPINFSTDDEVLLENINLYLGEKFDDIANELVKNSSNKGVEWLHPYIDEEGQFNFIIVPSEQIIPIYEDKRQTKIKHIIRYYPVVLDGESVTQVELWSDKETTYYILKGNKIEFDSSEEHNPRAHFYYVNENEKTETPFGWDELPFIPFRNNEEEKGDLTYYKELIDAYDNKVSDNQNSFEEIQELIYILRGYEGQSLSEFMNNLKHFKAVNVDSDGGVDTLQAEIPMESINSHLDRLERSIFRDGQGVNTETDELGNSPSGIALKFLYSLLDMKSDTLERKFRVALQQLIWFLCEYLEMSGISTGHDYKSVDYTFKRSVMSNDLENAEIAQKSLGVLSEETILANHAWVDNVEVEKERLRIEREERENSIIYDLDKVIGDNQADDLDE